MLYSDHNIHLIALWVTPLLSIPSPIHGVEVTFVNTRCKIYFTKDFSQLLIGVVGKGVPYYRDVMQNKTCKLSK